MKKGDMVLTLRAQESAQGDKIPYLATVEIIKVTQKAKTATICYHCICCGSYVRISGVPLSDLKD